MCQIDFSHKQTVALLSSLYILLLSQVFAEESSNEEDCALTAMPLRPTKDKGSEGVVTAETYGVVPSEDELSESDNLFEASTEWKTVKKGQRIPNGLHVRLSLLTGEKEAKLMENEVEKRKVKRAGKNVGIVNTHKILFTPEELKQAVNDFKVKDGYSQEAKDDAIKSKYRSYDELKEAMKEMELNIKTEAEIVTELVRLIGTTSLKSKIVEALLVDLEYYLHQFDNARLFCDLSGMKPLLKLMNSTEDNIRDKATHALAAAAQSNGKVQVEAIENGMLQQLLLMLTTDSSSAVRKKTLFALSSLLRHFPYAQKKFLVSGGLSALAELFCASRQQSLRVKVVTLLADLVLEHDLNMNQEFCDDKTQKEKSLQYSQVNMHQAIQANGWCSHMGTLLEELTEHDDVEKTLTAMAVVQNVCKGEFANSRPKLKALSSYYNNLAKDDEDDGCDYFSSIYITVETLLENIPLSRDEL